jgi:hypothetical protein
MLFFGCKKEAKKGLSKFPYEVVSSHQEKVFTVYAPDKNFKSMENFAKKLTGAKKGAHVIFFDSKKNTPDISVIGLEYPSSYDKYQVAVYMVTRNGEFFTKQKK